MILEMDCGNSFIKWRALDAGVAVGGGVVDSDAALLAAVFDHAFLNEHTAGVLDYIASLDDTPWEHIVEQS